MDLADPIHEGVVRPNERHLLQRQASPACAELLVARRIETGVCIRDSWPGCPGWPDRRHRVKAAL